MRATFRLPREFNRLDAVIVHQGECRVTNDPDATFSTVLGSCVCACVRDVRSQVGGMNHFLLPEQSSASRERFGESARYGAFAMEDLINQVLNAGSGDRSNLEIKVFGGGNISSSLSDIGAGNCRFVRSFLNRESYRVAGEDLGGDFARRVLFKPLSGRVFVKRLDASASHGVIQDELVYAGRRPKVERPDDIELF